MKKISLTIAIVLTMGLGAFAQYEEDGSMLKRSGDLLRGDRDMTTPSIPIIHGAANDQNGDGAPLGSGVAVLFGLGAAYMVAKKRKED